MLKRFFAALAAEPGKERAEVEVMAVREMQRQGAQLIDVREPMEYASGHIRGARNIPLGQLSAHLHELKLDGVVLVICRSGSRSRSAQTLLQRHQFSDVRNVRGGISAWQAAGLPLK